MINLINPLPQYCIFIVFLLPAIWFAGLELAKKSTPDTELQLWLAPGLSLAIWLISTQIIGNIFNSFSIGLCISSLVITTFSVVLYFKDKDNITKYFHNHIFNNTSLSHSMWLSATITTFGISLVAFAWNFHDELYVTGHMSIVSQLQNDTLPLIHLSFPDQPLKYHYGFDLFAAILTALFRVPVDVSIDIATAILWFYSWCLLWKLGIKLSSVKYAGLLPLLVLLGGGLPFFGAVAADSLADPLLSKLLGLTSIDNIRLNASFVSYFFQHPWGLGLPFSVSILLLTLVKNSNLIFWRYTSIGILFIALSFSHVVLFLTFLGSFILTEFHKTFDDDKKRIPHILLLLFIIILGTYTIGGFFISSTSNIFEYFSFTTTSHNTVSSFTYWHFLNFGLLLPLGIAGIFYLKTDRIFFMALLTGTILIFNLFKYDFTLDVIKFATVTTITLSILTFITLSNILKKYSNSYLQLGVFFIISIIISSGLSFVLVSALKPANSFWEVYDPGPVKITSSDISAINWLRSNVNQKDIILRRFPAAYGYTQWGGLTQFWIKPGAIAFGVPQETLIQRIDLQTKLPSNSDEYLNLGVRWLILQPGDSPVESYVPTWLKENKVVLRAEFQPLKIYEIISHR